MPGPLTITHNSWHLVTPIRPQPYAPVPQATTTAADTAKLAAVRAMFANAMGQTAPVATPEPAPASVAARPSIMIDLTEPPQKILRPGSLLDIRV